MIMMLKCTAPETDRMDIIISVGSDMLNHLWEGLDFRSENAN
jgi:hypothetical protein